MNPFACSEWDRIGRIELCRDLECTQKDEIARWITPYWRRGTRRWFLDVSPFLALLSQPNVQLQQPVPEAGSPGDSSAGVAGMPDDGGSGESGNPGVQNQGGQGGAGGEAPEAGVESMDTGGVSGADSEGPQAGTGSAGTGGASGMEQAIEPDSRRYMRLIMGPNWSERRNVM